MNISPLSSVLSATGTQPSAAAKADMASDLKRAEVAQGPSATKTDVPDQAVRSSQETSETSLDQKLEDSVKRIEEFVGSFNNDIKFSVEEEVAGSLMVRVVDAQTEEVIRQIPSEEAVRIAQTLDQLKGLLLYNKA